MDHHIHCSIRGCDYAALFRVLRFQRIGLEPLCELHYEWLVDNTRRPFTTRRITNPCDCIRAIRVLRPVESKHVIDQFDQIVGEEAELLFGST